MKKPPLTLCTAKSRKLGINVWIVDKNTESRAKQAKVIDQSSDLLCGHSFSDGAELIQHVSSAMAVRYPDVVILDVETCKIGCILAVKSLMPQTALLFVTPSYEEDLVTEALRLGAASIILRDSPKEQILHSIREVYNGAVIYPTEIAKTISSRFDVPSSSELFHLTNREQEVLSEMSKGNTQKEIASRLFISHHTVNTHIQHIYEKMEVRSGIEAVVKAIRAQII